MADVAIRALGIPADQGSSTTITPAIPAGTQVGDLMLAFLFLRYGSSSQTLSCSEGWDEDIETTDSTLPSLAIYRRVFQTGDGDPTITNTVARSMMAVIISFYNTDTSASPYDVSIGNATFTAPADPFTVTITGFNTVADGAMAVVGWHSGDDNTWDYLEAGGTQQYSFNNASANASFCIAIKEMATHGGTGDQSANETTKGGDAGRKFWFAIKPSGVAAITIGAAGSPVAQTAKVTEGLAASVSAQTTLDLSVSQSAKLTEVLGAEVMAAVVEPLEVANPQQAAKLTEDLAVSVSIQTTLEATASQSAKVTEDLVATVVAQVALAPSISESAKLTEDKTVTVSAQITLETNQVESAKATEEYAVSVAAPVTLEISSAEPAKVSEDLAAEIGAMLAMEVSTPVETAKANEDLTAAADAPVTLEASIADNAKGTEESTITLVGGDIVEDLNIQVISEVAHVVDYIAPPLRQSASITDVITVEVSSAVTLAPSIEQSAKVTEELVAAVATQVALEPSISDNAKTSENLAASVASQPILEVSKSESAKVTEALGVAVASPLIIEISTVDTVRATEARTVVVEGQLAILEVMVAETVKAMEATASQVIAQVALELAAIDSVAVVDTPLVTLPEEGAVALFNAFMRIPGRYMIAGSFIQITECDEPVDNLNKLIIKE